MTEIDIYKKSIIELVLSDTKQRQSGSDLNDLSALEVACATRDAMLAISDAIYSDLSKKVIEIINITYRDAELYTEHPSIFSNNAGPVWWRRNSWPSIVCTGLSFDTRNATKAYVGIFMPSKNCMKEKWIKEQFFLSDCVSNEIFNQLSMQKTSSEYTLPAFPKFKYVNELQVGTSTDSLLMAASLKPYQGDQFLADWIAEQTLAYAKSIDEALKQA